MYLAQSISSLVEPVPESTGEESGSSSTRGRDENNQPERQLVETQLVDPEIPCINIYNNHKDYFGRLEVFKVGINHFINLDLAGRKAWKQQGRDNKRPISLINEFERILYIGLENDNESVKSDNKSIQLVEQTVEEEFESLLPINFMGTGRPASAAARPSSTPLEPPRTNQGQTTYSSGNIPPRSYSTYTDNREIIKYKNMGKKYPIEVFSEDTLLNINKYSPQLWPEVIQQWKNITTKKYLEKNKCINTQKPLLVILLREYGMIIKKRFPENYRQLLSLGNNPYNFINTVSNLITATDPNSGSIYQQAEAVRKLGQLKLNDPKHIVSFMEEFIFYTSRSQNNYNKDFMYKLLVKNTWTSWSRNTRSRKRIYGKRRR